MCTPLFNHKKALLTTHNDESIALRLRHMFVQDLPLQLDKAEALLLKGQIDDLQSQLHYILGSAQVCAADSLIKLITELKSQLKTAQIIDSESEKLWQEIKDVNQSIQSTS